MHSIWNEVHEELVLDRGPVGDKYVDGERAKDCAMNSSMFARKRYLR